MGGSQPIRLPPPEDAKSTEGLPRLLAQRRSCRRFRQQALTQEQMSLLLWSAQGKTGGPGKSTVPSAGATFPLHLRLVTCQAGVEGLDQGIYAYQPGKHELDLVQEGSVSRDLAAAALNQSFLAQAAVVLALAYEPLRITPRYGQRSFRYAAMEAGHAGQNVHLMAAAFGLGTVMIGAFDDEAVGRVLSLPQDQQALYLMPVGVPA